jgi:hypothetical protein
MLGKVTAKWQQGCDESALKMTSESGAEPTCGDC